MKDTYSSGPAFLNELQPNATLSASFLAQRVQGAEKIRDVIMAIGTLYESRAAGSKNEVENKTFIHYDAKLTSGESVNAIAVLTRNQENQITEINLGYSPMNAVLTIAKVLDK